MPGGLGSGSGDQAAQIRRLQTLVDEYKSEIDRTARDSRDLENQLAEGAGLVKSTLLDDATARITSLESQIESLESSITQLTSANTALDAEVSDLMRRVASGEYNTQTERVIELKANPAAKVLAIRTQQLDDLRAENEALLSRLKVVGQGQGQETGTGEGDGAAGNVEGSGLVPRESWDRLVKEKESLEQAHAKRLQRLKEVRPSSRPIGYYRDSIFRQSSALPQSISLSICPQLQAAPHQHPAYLPYLIWLPCCQLPALAASQAQAQVRPETHRADTRALIDIHQQIQRIPRFSLLPPRLAYQVRRIRLRHPPNQHVRSQRENGPYPQVHFPRRSFRDDGHVGWNGQGIRRE